MRPVIAFWASCLLVASMPAHAVEKLRVVSPQKREATPFPIAAIVEELRRVSGDASFAKGLEAPPAPPPANGESEAADGGTADSTPEEEVSDADEPSSDEDALDVDFSSTRKSKKARQKKADRSKPAPGSREEMVERMRKQQEKYQRQTTKQSDDFRKAMEKQRADWLAAFQAQKERWLADRTRFLKSIPSYKAHLTSMPMSLPPKLPKASHRKAPSDVSTDAFVLVNGGMDVPIRDQADRGTCAAFAGVRALEVAAKGQGRDLDLSEQFFYWLSKPTCQETPCSTGGSWVGSAYAANLDSPDLVIPEENDCPYNPQDAEGNDTQTPLATRCNGAGALRLSGVRVASTEGDLLYALDAGAPVVVASTLSENYFKSKGIVTQADASSERTRDSVHSGGHAYLAVGYMALPQSMHAAEGEYCLIIANSWGEGWGAGGYACVTQKWFAAHRFDGDFLAPAEVMVR